MEALRRYVPPYAVSGGKLRVQPLMSSATRRWASAGAGVGAARMRAWRSHCYGGLAELRLEEARVPPLCAPDHLLVRVHTSSINPLDVAMVGGYGARALNALRALRGADVEFPLVVGRDFCGEVVAAGAGSRLRAGRRVWGVVPPHWPGAHADYLVVKDNWVIAGHRFAHASINTTHETSRYVVTW
ncbi:reticulon-4-interacting protein 1, mitochondrial [Papilio machaon]|nr:reticulon-4-interacting protein 1, mitochondrial [Papilio machaon]